VKLALGLPSSAFAAPLLFYATNYAERILIFEVSSRSFTGTKVICVLALLFAFYTPIPQSILVAFFLLNSLLSFSLPHLLHRFILACFSAFFIAPTVYPKVYEKTIFTCFFLVRQREQSIIDLSFIERDGARKTFNHFFKGKKCGGKVHLFSFLLL
jgi:hypothetical protein